MLADGTGCACKWGRHYNSTRTECELESCQTIGTTTICATLDPHAYCGHSETPAANFNDGSDCSCLWGWKYNGSACTGGAPTPPPTPINQNCGQPGSTTNCTKLDPEASCGSSGFPGSAFADGTGCSCKVKKEEKKTLSRRAFPAKYYPVSRRTAALLLFYSVFICFLPVVTSRIRILFPLTSLARSLQWGWKYNNKTDSCCDDITIVCKQ